MPKKNPPGPSHANVVRPASGPAAWDDPAPADTDDASEQDEDDDDDEELPKVVVVMLRDLGRWIPRSAVEGQPERVAWFLAQCDAELVGVFERFPEGPLPPAEARTILAGLREFSVDQSANLQRYLGVTEALQYGFHVDATLEQIVESFEDDGFDVIDVIRDGRVVIADDDLPGAPNP